MPQPEFIKPKEGDEIHILSSGPRFKHLAFNEDSTVPCKEDWHDCSFCVMRAEHRGLCIHSVRVGWKHRHDNLGTYERKQIQVMVQLNVRQLREMGPGPVILPETAGGGILGEPMDWWGEGRREL